MVYGYGPLELIAELDSEGCEVVGIGVLASWYFGELKEFELASQLLENPKVGVHPAVTGVVVAIKLAGD